MRDRRRHHRKRRIRLPNRRLTSSLTHPPPRSRTNRAGSPINIRRQRPKCSAPPRGAVFKNLSWWEPVAIASAIVGLVAIVPYVVAVSGIGGFADLGVEINLVMHVVGSAVVLAIVLVPSVLEWLTRSL